MLVDAPHRPVCACRLLRRARHRRCRARHGELRRRQGEQRAAEHDKGSGSPGAKVFADAGCGDCHTMATAGATGTVGPNLDELRPNQERVELQVKKGGNGMPSFAGKLSPDPDQGRGGLRRHRRRNRAGRQDLVRSRRQEGRRLRRTTRAASSRPSGTSRTTTGRRQLWTSSSSSPTRIRSSGAAAIRSPTRSERAGSSTTRGTSARPLPRATGRADPGTTTAFCSGSSPESGPTRSPASPASACNDPDIKANAFNYYQCDHGLGHGLMLYTSYDLPAALDYCHQLLTEFDQVACSGGVFMENQSSSFGLRTKWLSTKNLLYPCNSKEVKRQDKLYCYLLVTSHILPYVGGDWVKTADWCRRSERGWAAYCFQSYGRDVAGAAVREPRADEEPVWHGRQRREGVHLRRDPRRDEQQPAGSARRRPSARS